MKQKGKKTQKHDMVICSFCGKTRDEGALMLASQKGPMICSACVKKYKKVIEGEK